MRTAVEANSAAKKPLHVVVLGHVDAGKSTLMGRLLHELGYVDERVVRKNQQAAQAAGKASFGWAWVMDERDEERARGVTVDISMRRIQTNRCSAHLQCTGCSQHVLMASVKCSACQSLLSDCSSTAPNELSLHIYFWAMISCVLCYCTHVCSAQEQGRD